jgi:hypothetical protein
MLMLVALGVISATWMSVIAVIVVAQKLLPLRATIDVRLAPAIVGLGLLIVLVSSSVAGLTASCEMSPIARARRIDATSQLLYSCNCSVATYG